MPEGTPESSGTSAAPTAVTRPAPSLLSTKFLGESVSSQDQSAMSWGSGLGHIRVNSAHRAQSPTGVRCASIPSQAPWTCKGRPSYFRISPGGMKPQGQVETQAVAGKQWFQEPVSCSFKSCSVTQY